MGLLTPYQRHFKRLVDSLTYAGDLPIITLRSNASVGFVPSSMKRSQKEITAMLRAWSAGEQPASDELVRSVYAELRHQARFQLRRERPNHTLNTAALINEAYLKLVEQRFVEWRSRSHFFALAAELMRRILVDYAKSRHRQKRGGDNEILALDDVMPAAEAAAMTTLNVDLIALDEALGRLGLLDAQQVKIVELRYFAGLDIAETAKILKISPATVKRDWVTAKAWLKQELTGREETR